jgi:hypothetical protein
MKRLTLLFIGVFAGFSGAAQENDTDRIEFAKKFCATVIAHDQDQVIKLTDKSYRKAQIKFLGGDKTQFVNELFGGMDVLTDDYINLKFAEIETIAVVEVSEYSDEFGGWEYVFHIKVGMHTVWKSLLLKKDGGKFGFIGSQG